MQALLLWTWIGGTAVTLLLLPVWFGYRDTFASEDMLWFCIAVLLLSCLWPFVGMFALYTLGEWMRLRKRR